MLKLFSSLSLPSLLNNPHHSFRLNNERLDWKILDVASHKKCFIRLARIHCNFVKNNIVWIRGLFFCLNTGKFFAVVNNRLYQQVFSFWCKFLFELISAKNFGIFCNDFFAVNRNNCFVKTSKRIFTVAESSCNFINAETRTFVSITAKIFILYFPSATARAARRSWRYALISALISSRLISCSPIFFASYLSSINAF